MRPSRRFSADSVSVEPYTGTGAYGPVYGPAVDCAGKVSYVRQLVRGANGEEVVSEVTFYGDPADAASFPPESCVTIDGNTTTVITSGTQGRPGQTVLLKVTCQ